MQNAQRPAVRPGAETGLPFGGGSQEDRPQRLGPASPFSAVAPILFKLGFQPVPIRPLTKAPCIPGWQQPRHHSEWPDRCGGWGTGVLAAGTPGIDLDIRDWAINRAIITELLDVVLGAGPVRVGAFPKVLLPCYAETPFAKVATRWFALAGEDFTAESYQPHRVEVLGQGQQWVAFAIHPGTQRPYGWFRGSILDRPAHDLPHLDHATAIKLCNAAEHVLLRCGATPLQRCGAAWVEDKPATVNVPRQWVAGPTDGSWQRLGAEVIAKRVDHRAYSSPGGWRLKCPVHRGESNNSLVIDDAEQPGRVIFHCFAGCAWLDVARRLDELCR